MVTIKYHMIVSYIFQSQKLRDENLILKKNISSLYLTAREEIKRKDAQIKTLQDREVRSRRKYAASQQWVIAWFYSIVIIAVNAEIQGSLAPCKSLKIAFGAGKSFNFCAKFIQPTFSSAWYEQTVDTERPSEDKIAHVVAEELKKTWTRGSFLHWMESLKMGNKSLYSLIFSKKGFSPGQIKLEKFSAF